MIDLPKSTFYYRATTRTAKISDAELVSLIEDIQDELPCYGYRRVTRELCRGGRSVSHKRVARVMRAADRGNVMCARPTAATIRQFIRTSTEM